MSRFLLIILFPFFLFFKTNAQELNCQVQISSPGMSETDRQILRTLQSSLHEFINQTNWTNYKFESLERIEASILITVDDKVGSDEYKASIQVQSRRPVFQSSYDAPILNHNDRDFVFRYTENQSMEYADNTFSSNLTAVIAYYAYIIIGFDFDTFSPMGGTPFFEKAQSIVNLAQNEPEPGWKSFESQRNRYWLVENLFNSQYSNIRQAMYNYHRNGFDKMTENMDLARAEVANALEMLQRVHRQRPGGYLMSIIMTTKDDELINLFNDAPAMEKEQVVAILTEIDPSNSSKYRRITQPN